jgi:hypothetical protein
MKLTQDIKQLIDEAVEREMNAFEKLIPPEQIEEALVAQLPTFRKSLLDTLRKELHLAQPPLEITVNHKPVAQVAGLLHRQYKQVFKWLTSRTESGQWVPVWLWGCPGAGKSHLAEQLADGLKQFCGAKKSDKFFFPVNLGPTTTESKLVGFLNLAAGQYVPGLAYEPFKNGGLLFLDEIDVTDPGVLVALNALLSNRTYRFPNGELVTRHQNFFVLCGANTLGRGSVEGYKRQAQDAASRDRLVKVKFEIDPEMERALSKDQAWCKYVQKVRAFIQTLAKFTIHITPRASYLGSAALANGVSPEEVAESCLFAEMTEDVREQVIAACGQFSGQ